MSNTTDWCVCATRIDISLLCCFNHEHLGFSIILNIDQSQKVCNFHNFPGVFTRVRYAHAVLWWTSLSLQQKPRLYHDLYKDPFHFALIRNYWMITSYLNRLALLYSFRMVFHPYSKQAISRLVNMFELVSIVVEPFITIFMMTWMLISCYVIPTLRYEVPAIKKVCSATHTAEAPILNADPTCDRPIASSERL